MTIQTARYLDYILTFPSSHAALKAENLLNQKGIKSRLIAAPRAVSSECGFCILLENFECDHVVEKLRELSVSYATIYTRQQIDGITQYAQQA